MRPTHVADGRLAGCLYLVVVLSGLFCLAYVPGQVAAGDPRATLANIAGDAALVRAGIAAFLVMQVAFLLLPLALYRSFRDVSRSGAVLMVAFAATSVPLGLAAVAHRLQAVQLLGDPGVLAWMTIGQRDAAAQVALQAYGQGLQVTQLFWGLWLLPLGWMIVKSGRLPRLLGVLLMLGCVGYLVRVFAGVLTPAYQDSALADYVGLPAAVGEIGTCLWLLLFGVRVPVNAGPASGDDAAA